MELAVLFVIAVVVVALAVAVGIFSGHSWWSERRAWRSLVARRVVVNLKNGAAVDGVLVARQGPLLRVREAVLHGGSDDPAPLDGEIVIERSEVEYLQYPST